MVELSNIALWAIRRVLERFGFVRMVSKLSPKLIAGILVALFFGISLYLRVVLPYDQVFSGDWIKFTGIDAYYHMRLVDNLVYNFPHLINLDFYFIYPGIDQVINIHFFDWLLAGIIWVIGFGSPTQHTIDVIGVYFPAVLGALTVIPVYFIGKELFNRWVGVLSAGLIAVMPGEFIGRSILGFTDQHIFETLITTVTLLFLILAIKAARQRQLTFSHLKHYDWTVISKPAIYSLLAGFFLGLYLITWAGALLFVFIITVYFIVQFIIDHVKQRSTDYLCFIGAIVFLVALIIFVPFSQAMLYIGSLIIALLIPLFLNGVSRLMTGRRIKTAYYPLTLVGLALAGFTIFYVIAPSLAKEMLNTFSIFAWNSASTTLEMAPLLKPYGEWSIAMATGNFTTGFFLSFISLGILIYLATKQGSAGKNLLLVWSVVILAATLGQRRFGYYFAVNVAVLTGYLSWQFLQFIALLTDWLFNRIKSADFRERMGQSIEMRQIETPEEVKPEKRHTGGGYTIKYVFMSLAILLVFIFVFFFNIPAAVSVASKARFAPSDGWQSALSWMRENTPEPFGDADFYYELYEPPPPGERYNYPDSAYGVTAWWDYGYWITRTAHRLPSANPSQAPEPIISVAHLFLSQEESQAREEIQKLSSSYLILDNTTTDTKFWAIINWAGKEQTEFFENYYMPYEGKLVPVRLLYPEYYRSLCVRLYNFDGKAVAAQSPLVISYEENIGSDGRSFKQITNIEPFETYEEALSRIESNESEKCRIVGNSLFTSPVPLEPLRDYKLVYASDATVRQQDVEPVPEVKIFEYIGD